MKPNPNQGESGTGLLILNADDWGMDCKTTDSIFECSNRRRISTVSAMVFMADSERAAEMGRNAGIIAGLHLNLTAPFTAKTVPTRLAERQRELAARLRRYPFARTIFHPGLRRVFEYVVAAQLEEFHRLYGAPPARIDGHHHIHLSANVLLGKLLPEGTTVRRSFSFRPGEKGSFHRLYGSLVNRILARRHVLADYFFALAPLEQSTRLQQILQLATAFTVEVETHPAEAEEFQFLLSDEFLHLTKNISLALPAKYAAVPSWSLDTPSLTNGFGRLEARKVQ